MIKDYLIAFLLGILLILWIDLRWPLNGDKERMYERVIDVQGALIVAGQEKISDLRTKLFLAENHRERRKK